MLSIILLCTAAPAKGRSAATAEAVVRTLSALVSASVRGLVRDVVLAGPAESELGLIADHAGCVSVEATGESDGLRRALDLVRGDDLLVFIPGHVPESGFIEEIEDFLAHGAGRVGRGIRAVPITYWQRLFPTFTPVVGLLAPVAACRAAAARANPSLDTLIQATAGTRVLRARAHRIG